LELLQFLRNAIINLDLFSLFLVHFYVYFSIERERRKREGERGGEGGEREREAREKLIDNQMDD